jgi:hypothetical protein
MKLVEVVVLMGAHCISPLQNTGAVTEAAKVQCAVVVEKDTTAGTIRIVPAAASQHPEVAAVVNRLDSPAPAGTTIEPANAPPVSSSPPLRTPPANAVPPPAEPPPAIAAAEPPAPVKAEEAAKEEPAKEEAKATKPTKAAAKKEPAQKDQASVKASSQCRGTAKPKWYTNAEGRRKYRCVSAG